MLYEKFFFLTMAGLSYIMHYAFSPGCNLNFKHNTQFILAIILKVEK